VQSNHWILIDDQFESSIVGINAENTGGFFFSARRAVFCSRHCLHWLAHECAKPILPQGVAPEILNF
jgi:hypothetical protein